MAVSQKDRNYVVYYDLLNVLACFSVVVLHVNNTVHTFSYDRYWISAMFLEATFYAAVPIFLMLSGATLMDYRDRYDTRTFLIRRLGRTVIPFLFWSFAAAVWRIVITHEHGLDWISSPAKLVDVVLNYRGMSIYWFFPGLFAAYLAIPVLSRIPKQDRLGRRGCFPYMIGVTFLLTAVLPLLCKLTGISWNSALTMPVAGGYVIFLLLGYLLSHTVFSARARIGIYLGGAFGWLLYFGGTILLSYRDGSFNKMFKGYTGVAGVLMGVAVFELFRTLEQKGRLHLSASAVRVLKTVSGASFGVYLIHIYWRDILVHFLHLDVTGYLWRFLGPIPVYLLAMGTVLLLKKIPGLRRMIP